MVILFFKSLTEPRRQDDRADQEPVVNKMRRILESHVKEAETDEDRERAERDLAQFNS